MSSLSQLLPFHQVWLMRPQEAPYKVYLQIPDFCPERCKYFELKGAIYDKGHHMPSKIFPFLGDFSKFSLPSHCFVECSVYYFLTILPPRILILIFLRASLAAF